MAVIEEIPRRIGDEMQRVANLIVDGMQSEVEAMSKIIRIQNSDANRNAVAYRQQLEDVYARLLDPVSYLR